MTPKVLFEDSSLIVIDKPSGMVVNRADSVKGVTLQEWVENNFQFLISNFQNGTTDFEKRAGIVHRIDKETSGILLVAKTPVAFAELQRQFKAREIGKMYLALVHGRMEPASGVVTALVGRLPWNRERFGVLPGGREAETGYKVTRLLSNSDKKQNGFYSLVEFYPRTGRTHQIRVHAKYLHHPLVGDSFYAGRKTSRRDREWCPRLFLHAAKIIFKHPETKEKMVIASQLPEDLQKALNTLDS